MSRKAVFLDLQGTLGGDAYGDITGFSLFDFSKEALEILQRSGFLLFIVTNQSRIAKGFVSRAEFDACAKALVEELGSQGITITEVFVCPHQKADSCICRKPSPYFPRLAAEKYGLDLDDCIFIGDIYHSDVEMARNVGAKAVLVLTGKGHDSLSEMEEHPYPRAVVCRNVLEAAKMIEKGTLEKAIESEEKHVTFGGTPDGC